MKIFCKVNLKPGITLLVNILQLIQAQMEIIYRYTGHYPFGLQKEPQNTYVELIKLNLAEEDINHYKLKYKFFREMVLNHLIKLIKLSREDNDLRFLYEYESLSLEKYLQQFSLSINKKILTDVYKYLLNNFITNIEEIIKELIHYQIKTDLLLNNLAVSSINGLSFKLKFFLQPQCECFAIKIFSKGRFQQLKNLIHQNKESLIEFYSNQKTKMIIEFQELIELYFGKFQAKEKRPNFIINGTKLVFINNQEGKTHLIKNENIQRKKSTSSDKTDFNMKHSSLKERRGYEQIRMIRKISSLQYSPKKQIKTMSSNKNLRSMSKKLCLNQSINDESYSILFETDEIKKDQTIILQEQEYLQSLEDQIQNIRKAQKLYPKQTHTTQPSSNISKTQDPSYQCKMYNSKKINNKEPKIQKKNKYKMKITTSHNVEIQEDKDTEIFHVYQDNLKADTLDNSDKCGNNQQYFKNNNEKVDDCQSKHQVIEQKLFDKKESDGDTFFFKNQLFSKSTAASFANNDQHQNLNKYYCKTDNYKQQFETKQPLIQKYLVKIQSAKEKAQKLLRQYTHNKLKKCNRFS